MQYKTFESMLLIAALTLCACQHRHQPSEYIQTADSLLWSNPDSCLRYIESRTGELSEYDQNCEELIWQHALYRLSTNEPINDSILEALNDYFDSVQDWERAGETEYIRGAYDVQIGDIFFATYHLKRAENYYESSRYTKPVLRGMVYMYLGGAASLDRNADVAIGYYEMAIPYLKESNKPLHLAATYVRMGLSCDIYDTISITNYLDSAQKYAELAGAERIIREIRANRIKLTQKATEETDSIALSDLIYLCDTTKQYQFAHLIAQRYLDKNDLLHASEYIEKTKRDTGIYQVCKEQFYMISAELLYRQDKPKEAYKMLREQQIKQFDERSSNTYNSYYLISEKYGAFKEQLWRQEEQEKKERAYMWLAICALLCLLAGSSAGYLLLRHKKTQLQLQLNEERSQRLEQEVETQQKVLQAKLRERVEVVKQLHQWSSKHDIKLPKSIDLLSPQRAARDQDNWKKFYEEYNLCYADKLNRMKEQNPELTESDLQCLALEDLGFDTSEMAFILGLTKRTVWNRRNLAKQHLGEEMIDD